MHEYRATEKDLDGTGPGKGPYVLCRLFCKMEEKVEKQDAEVSGLSPAARDSPDHAFSDIRQEIPVLDLEHDRQSEEIRRRLIDTMDNLSRNDRGPVGSCTNSNLASDIEDGAAYRMPSEVHPPAIHNTELWNLDQVNWLLFSPDEAQFLTEPPSFNSPFISNFGNGDEYDGMYFQDYMVDVWDKNKIEVQDDSCEDLTSLRNSVFGSETQLAGKAHGNMNAAWVQQQNPEMGAFWLDDPVVRNEIHNGHSHLNASAQEQEFTSGHLHEVESKYFPEDSLSAGYVADAHNLEESTDRSLDIGSIVGVGSIDHSLDTASNMGVEGGIKIRTQLPRVPSNSGNILAQGTAPRRLRLRIDHSRGSMGKGDVEHNVPDNGEATDTAGHDNAAADEDEQRIAPSTAESSGETIVDEIYVNQEADILLGSYPRNKFSDVNALERTYLAPDDEVQSTPTKDHEIFEDSPENGSQIITPLKCDEVVKESSNLRSRLKKCEGNFESMSTQSVPLGRPQKHTVFSSSLLPLSISLTLVVLLSMVFLGYRNPPAMLSQESL